MKWLPIDRDENGFATEECLDRIFNNLPCAVCSQTEGGYKYYNFVSEYLDMWHNREDLRTNTGYTHYLPIPKLESANNIQQCINNAQTNLQQVRNYDSKRT